MDYEGCLRHAIMIQVACPACHETGWFDILFGPPVERPCPNCGATLRVGLEPVVEAVEPEEPNG